jgi:hypothetical protein
MRETWYPGRWPEQRYDAGLVEPGDQLRCKSVDLGGANLSGLSRVSGRAPISGTKGKKPMP